MRTFAVWILLLCSLTASAQTRRPVNSTFPEQRSPDVFLTLSVNQTLGETTNATCVAQVVIAGVTNGPNITILWSQATGPGTLTFTDPTAFATEASASSSGTYTIACQATWKTKTSYATFTFFSVDNTITAVPLLPGPISPATFYRGINMNGAGIMIGSNLWESSSFATITGTPIADQTVTLTPAAEANTSTMIRSSLTGAPTCSLESVPSGAYLIRVYAWGWNHTNAFDLTINGAVFKSGHYFATTNEWAALGFYSPIYVTAGTIDVSLSEGNLSGVEVWRLAANSVPDLALTAPNNGASFITPVTIPVSASASDRDGSITNVAFYIHVGLEEGTLLANVTSPPYVYAVTNIAAGNYSFHAVADDNQGAHTISDYVSINVTAPIPNLLPIVSVTSPADAQVFIAPASFTITAAASDPDGSVTSVSFFSGSTLLGTDTASPYSVSVSGVAAGTYSVRAEATDDDGAIVSSATVNAIVNANAVPLVSLTAPTNGASFLTPVTIPLAATASDSDGSVVSVSFFSAGTLLGTDTSSPYTYSFASAPAGNYSFTAVATDDLGATNTSGAVSISISAPAVNVPPIVSVTSPADAQVFIAPASFTITATASDPDGSVSSVRFLSGATVLGTDLTSPYSVSVSAVPAGAYPIRAEATDNSGAIVSSATINAIVNANAVPLVSLTAPTNGASFLTPVTIPLAATASDSDGSVASVSFFSSGTLLGTDTTSPYTFSVPSAPAGNYSFTAVATDNLGATKTSGAVSVNVTVPVANIPPIVSISSPTNSQAFTAPASFTITAAASDSDGSVSSVSFFSGATLLGTDTTSPYTVSVSSLQAGTFSVRAEAQDNSAAVTSSATINVVINPVVIPLSAFAGQDQTLTLPATATLAGSVAGTSTTSTNWTKVSGPGTVTFGNANAIATTAAFSVSGTYTLQLAVFSASSSAADSAIFTVLPAVAPSAITNSLPLEVAGENGFVQTVQFVMPTVNPASIYDLYLRVHNLSDTNKAQVRINNGAWISLNNTATLLGNARAFGGIGGAFHTIKMTVPLAAGTAVTGLNTLQCKILFSPTGGVNPIRPSAYRIIEWNVRLAGVDKIPATSFVQENPNTWQPPHNTAAEIAQGQVLWYKRNHLVANGAALTVGCTDCHAEDGRDLKYYNYSNGTIIERAKFHGLSQLDGELIASYIRSVDTTNPGRPWNPPYQPGPGLDSLPVASWAAGAGIDAVVDNDQTTISDIFTVGASAQSFTNYQAITRTNNTNAREVRVALQFPDWNHWLPTIHPKDAYGTNAFINAGSKLFTSYEGGTVGASVGTQWLRNTLSVGSASSLANSKFILASWILEQTSETSPYQLSISPKTQRSTMAAAQKAYATACWQLVKMWELHQKYKLEDLAGANITRPNYAARYDTEKAAFQSSYDGLAASSSGQELYSTMHQMMATLSMWEATSNVVYIAQALTWAETICTRCTIVDSNGQKNWPGTWASPYSATLIAFEVEEYQGTAEMTRLVDIIWNTASLATYRTRATAIYNLIRDNTIRKILTTRGGLAGFIQFLTPTTDGMNDKPALMLRNLLHMSRASTAMGGADNTTYGWPALVAQFASGMRTHFGSTDRFTPYAGGLVWDLGFGGESTYTAFDTTHANRIPPAIIELYKAGIEFTKPYIDNIATLFTQKMWDGSLTAPQWVNFIDGQNIQYRTYLPYKNGTIGYGWNWLAEYDATTFAACSALLTYLDTGVTGNANDNQYFRLGLAAELARCATRLPNGGGLFSLSAEPRTQYSKRVYFDASPNILGLQPSNHGINDSTDPILFNYFSVVWYNVQLCIDAGNHSPDIFYQTSQAPIDWPYVVNKIKDLQVLTPSVPLAGEFLLFKIKSLQASSKLYGPKRWNSGGHNPYLTTNPDDFVFRDFNGFWAGTTAANRKAITVSFLRNWVYENKKYPNSDYYSTTDLPTLTASSYIPVAQRTAEHFGDYIVASFIPEVGGGYSMKNLGTSGLAVDTDLQNEILDWCASVWPLGWRRTVGGAINTWASLKP